MCASVPGLHYKSPNAKEKYVTILFSLAAACLKSALANNVCIYTQSTYAPVLGLCIAVHTNYKHSGSLWWDIRPADWELSGGSCGYVYAL